MNLLTFSKYQSIDENVLFVSNELYGLLKKRKSLDTLIEDYTKKRNIEKSINIERIILLAVTFLYSVDKIVVDEIYIRRK